VRWPFTDCFFREVSVLFSLKEGFEHLEPLGWQRLRLVSCLDSSRGSVHFAPRRDEDPFAAFREWTGKVVSAYGDETGPGSEVLRALLGASRLLTGDIGGADLILDNLPQKPFELDHGAGYCLVLPMNALCAALPLPGPDLRNISRWLAGSAEQAALRTWLQQHKARLRWDEPRGVYTLASTSAAAHDIDSDQPRDAVTRSSRLERSDELRVTRIRHPRFSSAQRWLIVGLVIVAIWSVLKWWAP
jgi:hypothetical protein